MRNALMASYFNVLQTKFSLRRASGVVALITGVLGILGACGSTIQAPTCSDHVKNGAETDIDCGGSECGPCGTGKTCAVAGDCGSHDCQGDICLAVSTCADHSKDGSETDVDCGGDSCGGCAAGKVCAEARDCTSLVCTNNSCLAATCSDKVKNGGETDVDCGGTVCGGCATGRGCLGDSDCAGTGVCDSSKVCRAPVSCVELHGRKPVPGPGERRWQWAALGEVKSPLP